MSYADWLATLAKIESGVSSTYGVVYTLPATPLKLWQDQTLSLYGPN